MKRIAHRHCRLFRFNPNSLKKQLESISNGIDLRWNSKEKEGIYASLHLGGKEQGLAQGFEKLLVHLGILYRPDVVLHAGAHQ